VFDSVFVRQFKKSRTDTQIYRAYKELQIPPNLTININLTVNVGNDNYNTQVLGEYDHAFCSPRNKGKITHNFIYKIRSR